MPVKVYQYPKCSTCRKALKWLDGRKVSYHSIDIVATPPKKAELQRALKSGVPLKKLFNTSGQSYREGGWSEKLGQVTEAQALDALAADGKLIKRPFVLSGEQVLVGFDEGAYAKEFK
ncbi:MAG: Spx/MgsR family RNA polymerase-binding regulatory protein [Myxococcales bacterium]|nr:MAG: Spx/MgsR family RNA polymerase-binding regulatory protein [Myxococcales bacterium]